MNLTILIFLCIGFIMVFFSDAKPRVIIFTLSFVLGKEIYDLYLSDVGINLGYSDNVAKILDVILLFILILSLYYVAHTIYLQCLKLFKKK